MASGTLGAEEEKPREKYKWSENSKVYTRKFKAKKPNNSSNPEIPTTTNAQINKITGNNDVVRTVDNAGRTEEKADDSNVVDRAGDESVVVRGEVYRDDVGRIDDNSGDVGRTYGTNGEVQRANDSMGEVRRANDNNSDVGRTDDDNGHVGRADGNNGDVGRTDEDVGRTDDNNSNKDEDHVANGGVDGNYGSGNGYEECQRNDSSLKVVPTEEANSPQPQLISSRVETASEDSLSLNRPETPVPNGHGHDENLANGVLRPMVTQVDDRVSISVSAAMPKQDVKELKRKLEDELFQVRKMAKRLEAKENQLSGYLDTGVGLDVGGRVGVTTIPVVGSLPFPVNGGLDNGFGGGVRMHSEVGSVGFNGSRPFRHLSVSVMDNNHGVGEIVEKEKRTPKANQYYRNSEFLLGKDRLPPAESNKKLKSAGNKKHGGRGLDYGFGFDKQLFKSCSNLLQKLMKHKHGWVFNQPVDVKTLGLHDYFDIIKHPMDLGTVKTRLSKNWYKTPREFAEDVRLTFHNAMTYNPEGQDVHVMAGDLLRIFEDKWPAIETEYERKLRYEMFRDIGVPTPTSRKTYAPPFPAPMPYTPPPLLHPPPPFQDTRHLERSQSMPVPPESRSKPVYSAGRTPAPKKPKAKDPDKRDMTFEEKQRLSTNLQSLPSEKLDAIVQIIKKRNSALSQHDDEIEVDIDSVDTETLWELDRFVTNYKKSLSKIKKRAELAQARAAAAAAEQAVQETIPAPANIQATQEARADEGNLAAASPNAQQEKHSDNGSDSSSSSSSSSDSGSSSSDSDSSSSSGYGSDGGQ